jgi:hypothetical protein
MSIAVNEYAPAANPANMPASNRERANIMGNNLSLIPTNFTLVCEDGKVQCHEEIIAVRCTLLADLMSTRPDHARRKLHLCKKRASVVARFVRYLEYGVTNTDATPFCDDICLMLLADEFAVTDLVTHLKTQLIAHARISHHAALMYELAKRYLKNYSDGNIINSRDAVIADDGSKANGPVAILRSIIDAAAEFIIATANRTAYEYVCANCTSTYAASPDLKMRCTHIKRRSTYERCGGRLIRRDNDRLVIGDLSNESRSELFDRFFTPIIAKDLL